MSDWKSYGLSQLDQAIRWMEEHPGEAVCECGSKIWHPLNELAELEYDYLVENYGDDARIANPDCKHIRQDLEAGLCDILEETDRYLVYVWR